VHIATKSSLNLFTLLPLDLRSSAQASLEKTLGSHERLKIFQDRLRMLEPGEVARGTTYDAAIFCGLPANFDEARVPRAPWAADELPAIAKNLKGVPFFLVSSLWGGIQPDGVVPEELAFERRKPLSHWEGLCQQYESKLLKNVSHLESSWHLLRLPLLTGSTQDGRLLNFSGMFPLIKELYEHRMMVSAHSNTLRLRYNPDSTLWFSPIDAAVHMFWRLLEDGSRPRICNLVSTQSTLNREWLQYLAQALGYGEAEAVESDHHNIPNVLRRMLQDNISIKTRNLFEVAGRYQQLPNRIDSAYFQRLLEFGNEEHWGRLVSSPEIGNAQFSEELAQIYFKDFLPTNLNGSLLKELSDSNSSIGFYIESPHFLSYSLQATDGTPTVTRMDYADSSPRIKVRLSGDTILQLMQNKLSFNQALLLRRIKVEGPLLDTLRIGNSLNHFMRLHPFKK